jgi:2-amino-4-hydroxy-6-hydroxymethyldihydropteridine diphosphokinase
MKTAFALRGAASKAQENKRCNPIGKAKPFRTSSGKAVAQLDQSTMFSHRNHVTKAYIALGSNLGDRAGNLLLALRGMMEAALCVCRVSSIYETDPVSEVEQPAYLNMVAEIGNPLPAPEQVMARLLRIEFALGRTREVKDGPRTLDLDLLIYGDLKSDTEFLILPHPRLHERRFVLEPLVEIAPHWMHPTLKCTCGQLLQTLEDKSTVKRWAP